MGAVAESESPSSISHSPLPRNPFIGRCTLVMQRPHAPTSAASSPACAVASMVMCVSRTLALGVVVPWARATRSSRTCFLCLTLGRSRMAYTSDYEVYAQVHFMPKNVYMTRLRNFIITRAQIEFPAFEHANYLFSPDLCPSPQRNQLKHCFCRSVQIIISTHLLQSSNADGQVHCKAAAQRH